MSSCTAAGTDTKTALSWVKNFISTVDGSKEVGKLIRERHHELLSVYNTCVDRHHEIADRVHKGMLDERYCDGYPPFQWRDQENNKAHSDLVVGCNSMCWQISFEFDLVPKE